MTTDTTAAETATAAHSTPGPFWVRPVGRHRKPRPRRVVLAVGGFALAAGALSLVRLAPESVTGGGGTAEAEPRIDTSVAATTTEATGRAVPSTGSKRPATGSERPSTAAPMAGASAPPTATAADGPTAHPSSSLSSAPRLADPATGIPEASSPPTASRTPEPPATTPAAARPATSPTATTHTPQPTANPPGLCVPIVGLCVNAL